MYKGGNKMQENQVWRLQTITDGGDVANYCIKNHVAAMGWALNPEYRDILRRNPSIEEFCRLADDLYEGYSSVKRLAYETQVNDIIWMKSAGKYYFARVNEKSEWKFDFSDEAVDLDATNVLTDIHWYDVDEFSDESSVPGCLTTGFIRGSTYQRIKKSGIIEYSQMLYNLHVSKEEGYRYDNPSISLNEENFWNLLQPDDVEDLLCLWLYKNYHYVVIPSTNKKGTELYECVLIDPNAEECKHIYIQVKKGDVTIDAKKYDDLNGEVFFLTTSGKVINADKDNYKVVSPKDIYEFSIDPLNKSYIPEGISKWIKFLTEAENENMNTDLKKGIMIDTNRSYSEINEMEMLSQSRICAYGDADRYIRSFNKGDFALFYSKGKGIIAIGEIVSDEPATVETEKGLYHNVNMIVPENGDYNSINEKYISAREIKNLLNRGFYFASTMKTPFLNKTQVDILIKALEKKYKE